MKNPIDIPGVLRPFLMKPLNPVLNPKHMDLFVDVDNSAEEFSRFQLDFDDLQWLSSGAIVVATGQEQTGKTALLYRCAQWLRDNPGYAEKDVRILDCADAPVQDAVSIDSRMDTVCKTLLDKVYQENIVVDERLLEKATPGEILRYLPGAVDPDVVIIAILPSSADLVLEIVRYAELVPKRVMLLAETPYDSDLEAFQPRIEKARAVMSILRLGPLNGHDGDLFFQKRRELHSGEEAIPLPAAGALERIVTTGRTTIGQLQKLLYGVYADIPSRPAPIAEVTYEHITDYFFRANSGGRR